MAARHRRQRRLRMRPRRLSMRTLGVAILLFGLFVARQLRTIDQRDSFSFASSGPYVVERVVDGDTLLLDGGTRVRLLGVDTPETKHPEKKPEPLGFEAYEFTRSLVEGRQVTLEFDRERRDRYRRVLAYVYVEGRQLNEELIRAGLSRAETQFPYADSMKRRFRDAEQEARTEKRGLWSGRMQSEIGQQR